MGGGTALLPPPTCVHFRSSPVIRAAARFRWAQAATRRAAGSSQSQTPPGTDARNTAGHAHRRPRQFGNEIMSSATNRTSERAAQKRKGECPLALRCTTWPASYPRHVLGLELIFQREEILWERFLQQPVAVLNKPGPNPGQSHNSSQSKEKKRREREREREREKQKAR